MKRPSLTLDKSKSESKVSSKVRSNLILRRSLQSVLASLVQQLLEGQNPVRRRNPAANIIGYQSIDS